MSGFDKGALGRNMRVRRVEMGFTQGDLAERVGVNVATIAQYENVAYVPGADKICAMAEALLCTPNDLIGFTPAA